MARANVIAHNYSTDPRIPSEIAEAITPLLVVSLSAIFSSFTTAWSPSVIGDILQFTIARRNSKAMIICLPARWLYGHKHNWRSRIHMGATTHLKGQSKSFRHWRTRTWYDFSCRVNERIDTYLEPRCKDRLKCWVWLHCIAISTPL